MSLPKEPIQPEDFPTQTQKEAVLIVDALYNFMAKTSLYSASSLMTAVEQIDCDLPFDKIEEDMVEAATNYLNATIAEQADE